MRLTNKRVVIIGGSSGMGFGIAEAAAHEGAWVIIASRSLDKCEAAAQKIAGNTEARSIDMSDEPKVKVFFEGVGVIDHLVIPGSAVKTGGVKSTSTADLLMSIQSKFIGPVLCAKHARFAPGGSLILFSGSLSRKPGNSALLGAINSAVETLAKGLAVELAPVRVNVISPGLTKGTGAFDSMSLEAREAMFAAVSSKLPVGRVGAPEDMAKAALCLMECGFMTGSVVDVDGGGLLV